MLVLIDYADIAEIEKLLGEYPYDGVTTNPSILKNAGQKPMELLKKIKAMLPEDKQLHAQVISETAKDMVKEARHMIKVLGESLYVKIPVTTEGYKAMAALHAEGVQNITATAIYTPMQAFMAAKAGACYTAPYVNRIDNLGANGVQAAKDIHTMFRQHGLRADVLGASFKNAQQVMELCLHGVGAVTVAPDVLRALVKHDSTDNAVKVFNNDYCTLVGPGKTMLEA